MSRMPVGDSNGIFSEGVHLASDRQVAHFSGFTSGTQNDITVPTNERWHIRAVSYSLITDATAGNRVCRIYLFDSSSVQEFRAYATSLHPPSNPITYVWQPGIVSTNALYNGANTQGLPIDLCVSPGGTFRLFIAAGAAGDVISDGTLHYDRVFV